jgi:hypothetical protein
MRSNQHARLAPQPVLERQRLNGGDVQRGAGDLFLLERVQKIVFDQMRPDDLIPISAPQRAW